MEDVTLAIVFMTAMSIGVFFAVRGLLRKAPSRLLDALAAAIVLLIGVYVRFVWNQLWIVTWIPLSSVIVLSNWFPLFLGALAGVFWARTQSQTFMRKMPALMLMIAGAVWSEINIIPLTPQKCENEWIEPTSLFPFRVCTQTTPDTCSPAAAATILDSLGVSTSEEEMAALCLTRKGKGTTWLGLYHGLTVRLRGTGYRTEFFECGPDELEGIVAEYPALLCCELTNDIDEQFPEYENSNGWKIGVAHSTVLFGFASTHFIIGDPSQKSPELWTAEDVANLWSGTGLRIVRDEK